MSECVNKYDPACYQCIGANLFDGLFMDGSNINNNKNYNSSIRVCEKDYYLPWEWTQLDEFLVKYDNTLPPVTFGIHWFNGAAQSKNYSIQLTKRILSNNFIVTCYLDRFISNYINFI